MVRLKKVQMLISFLENVYTSSSYLENGTSNYNCVPKQKGYTSGKNKCPKINAQYQSIYIIWYYQSLCEWTTSRTIGNFVVEYKLMNGCVGVERTFIVLSSNTLKVRGWNEWAQLELSNKPIKIDFIIMGLKYVLVNNLFWLLLALAWW